jgi:hypothetical protein
VKGSHLYAASGKISSSFSRILIAVHVVQHIDICFNRKTDVSYVEPKQTWCAKPATPSESESEQPRSVFLRRKRCTWWGFSRLPHITGPHFPHHGIIRYAYESQERPDRLVHIRGTTASACELPELPEWAIWTLAAAQVVELEMPSHKKRDNWNGEKLALKPGHSWT